MNTTQAINTATVPHRSPFRYPGGKTWLVPYIRLWLDSLPEIPTRFCEPFAGGGIVGLSALFEDRCHHLVLVEIDKDIAAVWQTILNGNASRLANRIAEFDVSEESVKKVLQTSPRSLLCRTFATILKNRVQRGGILAPGASLMKNGENGRGLLSRWYPETLKNRIKAIAEYRNRISFIQGDGIAFLLENRHSKDSVFFIDPPYTVAGRRLYAHSQIDHEALFHTVSQLQGDFLMSYDNAAPIRQMAQRFGFDSEPIAMKNTHHNVMTELLIGRNLNWLRQKPKFIQDTLFKSFPYHSPMP